MIIKCISLWQPWAWAMWNGLKQWETRSADAPVVAQLRKYSGEWIGIQAAQMLIGRAIELSLAPADRKDFPTNNEECNKCKAWFDQCFSYARKGHDLPFGDKRRYYGVLGGICRLGPIRQTQEVAPELSEQELFFGNYEPGRRAIHCSGMVKLETPIPMKGSQGAWDLEVPESIEKLLKQSLEHSTAPRRTYKDQ